ncbi:unnamed protein product, partial [Chrysoparadoxa australica]
YAKSWGHTRLAQALREGADGRSWERLDTCSSPRAAKEKAHKSNRSAKDKAAVRAAPMCGDMDERESSCRDKLNRNLDGPNMGGEEGKGKASKNAAYSCESNWQEAAASEGAAVAKGVMDGSDKKKKRE